jgi:hypothetical protein
MGDKSLTMRLLSLCEGRSLPTILLISEMPKFGKGAPPLAWRGRGAPNRATRANRPMIRVVGAAPEGDTDQITGQSGESARCSYASWRLRLTRMPERTIASPSRPRKAVRASAGVVSELPVSASVVRSQSDGTANEYAS